MPTQYTGVPCVCLQCGTLFSVIPSRIRRGGGLFCQKGCATTAANARRPKLSLIERLFRKVDRSGDCWVWKGQRNKKGYGRLLLAPRGGARGYVHRLSWEHHVGPIPEGLWVLHQCDNPPCVRPAHLFLGTSADNVKDMIEKGRAAWQRTN